MIYTQEELILMNDLKEYYSVRYETIQRIISDFKENGINDLQMLNDLASLVIENKESLSINKEQRKFSYSLFEQQAIDYYAKENEDFFRKHLNLISDGNKYLKENYDYFAGNYDEYDEEIQDYPYTKILV